MLKTFSGRLCVLVYVFSLLALCSCSPSSSEVQATSIDPLRAAAAVDVTALAPEDLWAWAQTTYPEYFSGPFDDGTADIYVYRHYSSTGNYIGVAGSKVYLMGPITNGQIAFVGTLGDFRCRVHPSACEFAAARRENDTFSEPNLNSCKWGNWSVQDASISQGNGLVLRTTASKTFSSARIVSQYRVRSDAQAQITVTALQGFDAVPQSAQLYASFGLMAEDNNKFFVALARLGSKRVVWALRIRNTNGVPTYENFPQFEVTGTQVRFRITQAGSLARLEFDAGAGWLTAAETPAFSDGAYVELTSTNVSVARDFSARFSDFSIASGQTTWREYVRGEKVRRDGFMAGSVSGDALNFKTWGGQWQTASPHQMLKNAGMNWYGSDVTFASTPALTSLRASLWNTTPWQDSFWRSRELVAEDFRLATAAGLRLYLQLLLSDQSAYINKQHPPSEWQGLSLAETADRARVASRDLIADYKARGLNIELVSVGNEVDLGVLGFTPGDRLPLPPPGVSTLDLGYLRTTVWPANASLFKAVIDGVKSANPDAKIVLHIAGLGVAVPSDIFIKSFFKFMKENGVNFDYAGLSHPYAAFYPWKLNDYTTDCWFQRVQETAGYLAELGKPTLIAEASYPRIADGYRNLPMQEFPYSDVGQAGFVREELRFANNDPDIAGFFYWGADYFAGMSQDSSINLDVQFPGLFYPDLTPTPALLEFGGNTPFRSLK